MTYGTNEKGEGVLTLTPEENEAFKRGENVVKKNGDAYGMFTIVIRMSRPHMCFQRFPVEVYGENYKPPE